VAEPTAPYEGGLIVPDNVLRVGPELLSVAVWTIVLLAASLTFAFKYHATSDRAGARGSRPTEEARKGEIVRPDGFIDSFSGVISEAGGGVPRTATIIMVAVFATWLGYLILNWKG
jgi:hypothetical protein